MNNLLCFLASIAISILILIVSSTKLKVEPEKFYFVIIVLYFLVSATKINHIIHLGFMICLINILSHEQIKNRKAKEFAMALGFVYCIVSVIIPIFP